VSQRGFAWAKAAADRVARKYGVERIDGETLHRWRAAEERTLYVLDVRDPSEYAAGHVPGAVSAPGGQLVQATDQYVGTLGARIVLVDDKEVRAVMTASWLRQMGWRDVSVLVETGNETGFPAPPVVAAAPAAELAIHAAALAESLARDEATVLDLSLSRNYLRSHIPRARWAIRSRLARALAAMALRGTLVLTSEDGVLAEIAAPEASKLTRGAVRYLAGGNAAWHAAGHPLTAEDADMADDPVDVWFKPYERPGGAADAMAEYLSWETDLLAGIERDGTCAFVRSGSMTDGPKSDQNHDTV
jgi:rhodanese-related sulfurtransferase